LPSVPTGHLLLCLLLWAPGERLSLVLMGC
jgi:hypothetical protein